MITMMVKKITLLCCIFLLAIPVMAQDVLIKRNGDELEVKVLNITAKKISYKIWGNFNQKVHTIRVLDVAAIRFENGSVMSYVGDADYYKEECDEEEEHDINEAAEKKREEDTEKENSPTHEAIKEATEGMKDETEVATTEETEERSAEAINESREEGATEVEAVRSEEVVETVAKEGSKESEEEIPIENPEKNTVENPEEVSMENVESTEVKEEALERENKKDKETDVEESEEAFSLMSYGEYSEEIEEQQKELSIDTTAIAQEMSDEEYALTMMDTMAIAQEMSDEEYQAMLMRERERADSIKLAKLALTTVAETGTNEEVLSEEETIVDEEETATEDEIIADEEGSTTDEEPMVANETEKEEHSIENEEVAEEVTEAEVASKKMTRKGEEEDYIKIRKERDKKRRAALNIMGAMPERLDPNRYENFYNRRIKTYETVGYVESIVAWGIFLGVNISLVSRGAITVPQFGNRMIWSTVGCMALYWAPWGILSMMYGKQMEMISTASIYEKEFKLGDMNLSSGINVMHDNLTQKNNLGVGLKINF